jgi:hypothetical protein
MIAVCSIAVRFVAVRSVAMLPRLAEKRLISMITMRTVAMTSSLGN